MSTKLLKLLTFIMCFTMFGCEPEVEDIYDDTAARAYKSEVYGDINLENKSGQEVSLDSSIEMNYLVDLDLTVTNIETNEVFNKAHVIQDSELLLANGGFSVYINIVLKPNERITGIKLKNMKLQVEQGSKVYQKTVSISSSLWEQALEYTQAYFELGLDISSPVRLVGNSQYINLKFNKSIILKEI